MTDLLQPQNTSRFGSSFFGHRGVARGLTRVLAAAGVAGALVASLPAQAHAQEAADTGSVSGSGKGIVGGALLGAEVVMLPMGIAGLKPWWPYAVFGTVGAVGGAVGGWAVEQADPPAEAPLYMLAGGLALIIPTVVATISAVTDDDVDEDPSLEEPAPGQPAPASESVTVKTSRRMKHRPRLVGALIGVEAIGAQTRVTMGVPDIAIVPEYTRQEMSAFGVEQETVVHVPVVRGTF